MHQQQAGLRAVAPCPLSSGCARPRNRRRRFRSERRSHPRTISAPADGRRDRLASGLLLGGHLHRLVADQLVVAIGHASILHLKRRAFSREGSARRRKSGRLQGDQFGRAIAVCRRQDHARASWLRPEGDHHIACALAEQAVAGIHDQEAVDCDDRGVVDRGVAVGGDAVDRLEVLRRLVAWRPASCRSSSRRHIDTAVQAAGRQCRSPMMVGAPDSPKRVAQQARISCAHPCNRRRPRTSSRSSHP